MRNYSAVADATPAEWQAVLGVNLHGGRQLRQGGTPGPASSSGRASIVNVSSCYALTGRKGMGLYDATKAALLALTRTLAFEESSHGVRANAVCPGSTLTNFHIVESQRRRRGVGVAEDRSGTTTSLFGPLGHAEGDCLADLMVVE